RTSQFFRRRATLSLRRVVNSVGQSYGISAQSALVLRPTSPPLRTAYFLVHLAEDKRLVTHRGAKCLRDDARHRCATHEHRKDPDTRNEGRFQLDANGV